MKRQIVSKTTGFALALIGWISNPKGLQSIAGGKARVFCGRRRRWLSPQNDPPSQGTTYVLWPNWRTYGWPYAERA